MGSKPQSKRTPPPSVGDLERARERDLAQQMIRLLRQQLAAARRREEALFALLREKEEQLRTVIDEKYFHPVNPGGRPGKVPTPKPLNPDAFAHLTDQPQFDPEKDKEHMAKDEDAFAAAETAFETELRALEEEQTESHTEASDSSPSNEGAKQEELPAGVQA